METKEVRLYPADELQCVVDEDTGNLGSGSYGMVRLAFHNVLGSVAIKCFSVLANNAEKKIKKELETLNKINHANVLRIYGWTKWPNSMGIIMEYLPGGSLKSLLLFENASLDFSLRVRMSFEVADGLAFLHNLNSTKRLTHGDMKPENVLLTNDLHCKIADFGGADISSCSTFSTNKVSTNVAEHTLPYTAPERIKNPFVMLHPQQDVYSYGVILHMILTRDDPVPANMDSMIFRKAVGEGKRPDTKKVNDSKKDLKKKGRLEDVKLIEALEIEMKKCWNGNHKKRPTMVQVRDQLSKMLNNMDIFAVLLSVADTLKEMALIQPTIDNNQCISLSRLKPPDFVTRDQTVKPNPSPFKASLSPQDSIATVISKIPANSVQKVRTDVVQVRVLLNEGKLEESSTVCEALSEYLTEVTFDTKLCKEVVCCLVETAGKLTQKLQNNSSLQLLAGAFKICLLILDSDTKLRSLISIGNAIQDLVFIIHRQKLEPGIKSTAIPLLQALLTTIKAIGNGKKQIYAQVLSLSLYYLGRCHVYVKEYDEAIDALSSAIKIRIETFGENAAKLAVLGQCYVMLANAEKAKGDLVKTEKNLRAAIASFQKAEDISEETKRDVIRGLEESIKKLHLAPNVEALISLLMLLK